MLARRVSAAAPSITPPCVHQRRQPARATGRCRPATNRNSRATRIAADARPFRRPVPVLIVPSGRAWSGPKFRTKIRGFKTRLKCVKGRTALALPADELPANALWQVVDFETSASLVFNWLQVLGTAEPAQIDQRVRQQLHPIVPLLDTFKAEQQALEFVFPRKGPL